VIAGDLGLRHAELGRPMLDEHVVFLEGVLIEQQGDALARRQLALGVLGGDPARPAAHPRLLAPTLQFFEDVLHGASGGLRGSAALAINGDVCN
jgi:hypothetical protein